MNIPRLSNNVNSFRGNIFLAKRVARGLVKIGIVAPVTVGDMDVAVEPIWIYSRRVTGEAMSINV